MKPRVDLDVYAILGVEPGVSDAELRRAWRLRARRLHPDVCSAEQTDAVFRVLHAAWEQVRTPELRAAYDAARRSAAPPRPQPERQRLMARADRRSRADRRRRTDRRAEGPAEPIAPVSSVVSSFAPYRSQPGGSRVDVRA